MISPLSTEYLTVRFLIELFSFAPVAGSNDANAIAALGETHGDNSAPGAPNAEQTRFLFAMSFVNRNHPARIEKGALRFRKTDPVFSEVERILLVVPFEFHLKKFRRILLFSNSFARSGRGQSLGQSSLAKCQGMGVRRVTAD